MLTTLRLLRGCAVGHMLQGKWRLFEVCAEEARAADAEWCVRLLACKLQCSEQGLEQVEQMHQQLALSSLYVCRNFGIRTEVHRIACSCTPLPSSQQIHRYHGIIGLACHILFQTNKPRCCSVHKIWLIRSGITNSMLLCAVCRYGVQRGPDGQALLARLISARRRQLLGASLARKMSVLAWEAATTR
jgi:hypothetical protein